MWSSRSWDCDVGCMSCWGVGLWYGLGFAGSVGDGIVLKLLFANARREISICFFFFFFFLGRRCVYKYTNLVLYNELFCGLKNSQNLLKSY